MPVSTNIIAARNMVTEWFLNYSKNPDDLLVMLDMDHIHPVDVEGSTWSVIDLLAGHNLPVVGALCFRRSRPQEPLMFRTVDRRLLPVLHWHQGDVIQVDAVGTGAIAIRRAVFDELLGNGYESPLWRFDHRGDPIYPFGEDLRFCEMCLNVGIDIYCDTGTVSDHLQTRTIGVQETQEFNPSVKPMNFKVGSVVVSSSSDNGDELAERKKVKQKQGV